MRDLRTWQSATHKESRMRRTLCDVTTWVLPIILIAGIVAYFSIQRDFQKPTLKVDPRVKLHAEDNLDTPGAVGERIGE